MVKALKQSHDRLYETHEHKEIYLRRGARSRIGLRGLLETLDELNGDTVLDVGCAEGVFTLYLAKMRSFCVDLTLVKMSQNWGTDTSYFDVEPQLPSQVQVEMWVLQF